MFGFKKVKFYMQFNSHMFSAQSSSKHTHTHYYPPPPSPVSSSALFITQLLAFMFHLKLVPKAV